MNRKGYNLDEVVRLLVSNLLKEELSESEKEKLNKVVHSEELLNNVHDLTNPKYIISKLSEPQHYDTSAAYKRFRARTSKTSNHNRLGRMMKIAAVVMVPLLIVGAMWMLFNTPEGSEKSYTIAANKIQALGSNVYMVRSDGSTIDLTNSDSIPCTGVKIVNKGALKCTEMSENIADAAPVITYDEIVVPRGAEHIVLLPDGTQVWLNSDSRLKFPSKFDTKIREVYITGEAFFSVTKDPNRKFVVHTSKGNIEVLGTEFNVCDYRDDDRLTMTLIHGSVQYLRADNSVAAIIKPGEQLQATEFDFNVRSVDINEYVAWRGETYAFNEKTLYDIMKSMERRYDITVVFDNEDIKHLRFSGEVDRYTTIEPLLHFIEISGDVKFAIDNRIIVVSKK